jgi:hypothetical protein
VQGNIIDKNLEQNFKDTSTHDKQTHTALLEIEIQIT